jgi:hypothetical protein
VFDPTKFELPEGEEFFGGDEAEFIGGKGDEEDDSGQ